MTNTAQLWKDHLERFDSHISFEEFESILVMGSTVAGEVANSLDGLDTVNPANTNEILVVAETLSDVVEEYLHWRKVNPHIKGGENYLKRLRAATREPVSVSLEKCAMAVAATFNIFGDVRITPRDALVAKAVLDAAGVKCVD